MPAPRRPFRHGPRAALLLLLAAGTGCAAPGMGGGKVTAAAAAGAAQPSTSALAVRAFTQLCGALQAESVAQRARSYAFVPLEAAPREAEPLRAELQAKGLRGWIRPVSGAPALLTWNERGRSCELAVGGVEFAELEREFAAMARGLEQDGLAVTRVPPRAAPETGGTLRLRQAMVVATLGLTPILPRTIALRENTDHSQAIQAVLTMRPFVMPPAQPDDAVPVD